MSAADLPRLARPRREVALVLVLIEIRSVPIRDSRYRFNRLYFMDTRTFLILRTRAVLIRDVRTVLKIDTNRPTVLKIGHTYRL